MINSLPFFPLFIQHPVGNVSVHSSSTHTHHYKVSKLLCTSSLGLFYNRTLVPTYDTSYPSKATSVLIIVRFIHSLYIKCQQWYSGLYHVKTNYYLFFIHLFSVLQPGTKTFIPKKTTSDDRLMKELTLRHKSTSPERDL